MVTSAPAASNARLRERAALAGVVLVFIVLVTSAYLRLVQAGLGCEGWPECYGLSSSTRVVGGAGSAPLVAWMRIIHRLAASAVAIIVLVLAVTAFGKPRLRAAAASATALVALTLFLAVLGIMTPGSSAPAVTLGNVMGGMTMLGLLWWSWLGHASRRVCGAHRRMTAALGVGVAFVALQIALGALVSANLAARACPELPFCGGSWWPGTWEWAAFNLWRKVAAPAVGDPILHTLHAAHRGGALLVTLYWSALAATRLGRRAPGRASWLALAAALGAQLVLGIVLVRLEAPLLAAVAHNAGGALLLLAALAVAFYSRPAVVADVSAACQTVTSK